MAEIWARVDEAIDTDPLQLRGIVAELLARAEKVEAELAEANESRLHRDRDCYWRRRTETAEGELVALKTAIEGVLSDPIMHSPLGEPLVRVADLRKALDGPHSPADISTPVSAATGVGGETTEAQEG